MKKMTITFIVFFTLAALLVVPLGAGDSIAENYKMRCKLQGAWFTETGVGVGAWMMTFNGTGDNRGTTDWDFPIVNYPSCPGCSWTSGKGVWAKSGPDTYNYTYQSYFVDSDGNILLIGFNKGRISLMDCKTADIIFTAEMYLPGEDDPIASYPAEVTIHRLLWLCFKSSAKR